RLSSHRPDPVDQFLGLADRRGPGRRRGGAGVEPDPAAVRVADAGAPHPDDLCCGGGRDVGARPDQCFQAQSGRLELGRSIRRHPVAALRPAGAGRGRDRLLRLAEPGGRPMSRLITCAAAVLALAACGRSDPRLEQTGPNPDLPDVRQTLLPPMKIAKPVGWGDALPTVPTGYTVTALATDLQIPRQMLVLPNGDILVAEGRGGGAPALRPKDVIAGVIKKQGNTKVDSGNRVTLLRDADNDGRPEVRTVFIDN